jgi:hypothetical protein
MLIAAYLAYHGLYILFMLRYGPGRAVAGADGSFFNIISALAVQKKNCQGYCGETRNAGQVHDEGYVDYFFGRPRS